MAILGLLPVTSMMGDPFADYLNVTVPFDSGDDVTAALLPIIQSLGPYVEETPGTFRLYDESFKKTWAVFKFKKRGKVRIISASGLALAALRHRRCYGDYLQALASFPHRVSMLHATADYWVHDPADVVMAVKDAAFAEELSLTRKRILKEHVRALTSLNTDGKETGTIYLGNRENADVWGKVYDKRHERQQKAQKDTGPIVRVEIAVQSDVGATLKDAYAPRDLFFHFAGKSLVQVPEGFAGWAANGEGFVLPPRGEVLPLDRLQRMMDNSVDLRTMVDQAVGLYGDKAWRVLTRLIYKRCQSALVSV